MKKQSIFLVFLIISLSYINLSAQTSKGKFLVGGSTYLGGSGLDITSMNIGYTTIKNKDDSGDEDDYEDKILSFNFSPKVGYFVIDNLALGIDFTLASSFNKTTNRDFKYNTTLLTAGPFVRYYIPTKKVLPFAEAMYSLGSQKSSSEWDGGENKNKYGVQLFNIGIGVAIPIGEKASFDVLVGYQSAIIKDKEDNENNERTIVGTVGLKFGFTIFLGSK